MKRCVPARFRWRLAAAIALLPLLAACGDDETSVELVSISGFVINIDTSQPAENVVVSLLGRGGEFAAPATGADGLFFLQVPKNSAFHLVTNDWAGLDSETPPSARVDDDWITIINAEGALPVISTDLEVAIHACPTPGSPHAWGGGADPNLGSVAVWSNFIANSATATQFTDASDLSGKIVTFVLPGTPPNNDLGVPVAQITGVAITVLENDFGTVGYWSVPDIFNFAAPGLEGNPVQDATVGPDIFVDGGTATGPGVGLAQIFGNSGYGSNTINLSFFDTNTQRGIDFTGINPVEVPVRDGAATIVGLGFVDNELRTRVLDGLCAGGSITFGCE